MSQIERAASWWAEHCAVVPSRREVFRAALVRRLTSSGTRRFGLRFTPHVGEPLGDALADAKIVPKRYFAPLPWLTRMELQDDGEITVISGSGDALRWTL